ncbi:MAG: hypothetical protein ISS56_02340 [Anaerolineae bacterium]|nr:hypothetical protein [Anaerolineae bacterium]
MDEFRAEAQAPDRIGEIIETETTLFRGESFELHRPPELGRLVYVETGPASRIYGIVCHGTTASPDPGRRAVRRSTEGVYDEAIYREHPQLQRTLRTEFTARLVGCVEGTRVLQYLPPQPPPLHYSVRACSPEQIRTFTEQLTYLRLLLGAVEIPPEQLIAAHIREVGRARQGDGAWLARAARTVAGLLKSDYDRLMTVLYGIDPGL